MQATARPDHFFGLERLLSPLTTREFLDGYREQKHLLIQRDDALYFDELLTLADLDHVLSVSNFKADNTRIVIDGNETPIADLLGSDGNDRSNALEKVYSHFRQGKTIIINGLHERWEPLARMARTLSNTANLDPQINIYLTPAGSKGFKAHYDTHDVFIAQAHGSKTWRLYQGPIELPLQSQPWDRSLTVPDTPIDEFTLHAGDILYLPRGILHEGAANAETSMHITIGLHPTLWSTVIKRSIGQVFEENIEFRRALPPTYTVDASAQDYAQKELGVLAQLLCEKLVESGPISSSVRNAMVNTRHPGLRGHLLDLDRRPKLALTTPVRRRIDVPVYLHTDSSETVSLSFHGKSVDFPSGVQREIQFILNSDGSDFTAETIGGSLDDESRVILVESLLTEGLLTHA